MQIRKATMNDLPDILAIYAYAREYMKEHGNPDQWKDNYPPLELTTQDIRSGCLHVCIIRANDRERIGGVFYFHPEEDPLCRCSQSCHSTGHERHCHLLPELGL